MATAVSICNQALSLVGANSIISLDDNTTEARLCKAIYEPVRDALLEEHAWTFAIKWIDIPRLANPPLSEFKNAINAVFMKRVGVECNHVFIFNFD